MKKLIAIMFTICFGFTLSACEVSDNEIANALEGNLTRLVYSVGYLDAINEEELSTLVNGGSSYFMHSSLYTGSASTAPVSEEPILEDNSLALGGLVGSVTAPRNRVYTSGLDNTIATEIAPISETSTTGDAISLPTGLVDMSLIETSSADLNEILLEISQKRGIIMLYCTDLRSGKAALSIGAKQAIAEYTDIIKETTAYLNNNAGNLSNHFNYITSISTEENSASLINARLIRANEILKTRYAKLDTCLDSMTAIIDILHSSTSFNYLDLYNASAIGLNNTTNETITTEETTNLDDNVSPILDNNVNNISNDEVVTNENATQNLAPITENNTFPNCCPPSYNNCWPSGVSNYNQNESCKSNCWPSESIINNTPSGCCNNGNNNNNVITTAPTTNNVITPSTTAPTETMVNTAPTLENVILNETENSSQVSHNITDCNSCNNAKEINILNGGLGNNNCSMVDEAYQRSAFYNLSKMNNTKPLPITDLKEEEITESEKELLPDTLPLVGTITINPIKYERDHEIMLLPKK